MKKAPIVWLLIVIYSAAPCAGLLEAGCCLDDPNHHEQGTGPHQQVLSPFQIVAHALKHGQGQAGGTVLSGPHCCCLGAQPGDVGQGPHSLTRVRTRPPAAPSHDTPVLARPDDLLPITAKSHACASWEETGSKFALQSIQTTVLLV
jgi:hypothetical protein